MCAKLYQSCPTLCDSMDNSLQAPLSMGFSRHQYWSGLPFPAPGELPDPGIEPGSPSLQAGALTSELQGSWEPPRPEVKPVYPALASRFLTTGLPGKALRQFFDPIRWIHPALYLHSCNVVSRWLSTCCAVCIAKGQKPPKCLSVTYSQIKDGTFLQWKLLQLKIF